MTAPVVEIELPPAWRPMAVAPDGAPAMQRLLVDEWCAEQPEEISLAARAAAVEQLVRESRQAAREALSFAAVLLLRLDGPGSAVHNLLAGSLTVSFRALPGATDPALAAQGTFEVLRGTGAGGYPTRRVALVGLGRDTGRPAVLLREQQLAGPAPLALTQVLWLVAGTDRLASVAVATPNRELAREFTELALGVATTLRVPARASTGCA